MQRVRNGLTLVTAADDKSKALSDRGHEATGAAPVNVPGYKNRPAGLTQQNHPDSQLTSDKDLASRFSDLARTPVSKFSMRTRVTALSFLHFACKTIDRQVEVPTKRA